jgi:uncharacterized protein YcnI
MISMFVRLGLAFTIAAAFVVPATAHVTLEQKQAVVGAPYKAVFNVPHGCGGSATVRLRVQIPDGVIAVKPMAKPGWQIEVTRGTYAKAYSFTHGAKFTEGAKEVTWTGNLPDAFYDDFMLSTFISADLPAGQTLYFPVQQECEKGVHNWVGMPSDSHAGSGRDEPAPGVMLIDNPQPPHK